MSCYKSSLTTSKANLLTGKEDMFTEDELHFIFCACENAILYSQEQEIEDVKINISACRTIPGQIMKIKCPFAKMKIHFHMKLCDALER